MRAGFHRWVSATIASALVASGLFGITIVKAPPVEAALTCPSASGASSFIQTVNECEYRYLSAGTYTLPSGMSLGYTIIIIGGGGGGGGGQDPTGFNVYGYAGGVGGVVTGSGSSSSISITTVGAGGTGGANATTPTGTDARAGGSGGDTTVVGYATATGGTPGLVGGAVVAQIGGNVGYGSAGSGGSGGEAGSTNSVAGGGSGVVLVRRTMATVRANTPTVTANSNATLTVTASAPAAFPAVTSYRATCTSSDGGASPLTNTSSTTTITVSGVTRGKNYTCTVSAYNGEYGTESLASTSVLVPGAPENTTVPSFTGTPAFKTPGEVLTGNQGIWDDFGFSPTTYTYLWQSQTNCSGSWTDAAGATKTGLNYTIVAGDVGNCLRLSVSASSTNNPSWGSNTATSVASLQVTTQPAFTSASPPVVADVGYFAGYTFVASGNRITYSIDNTSPLTGLPTGMSINGSTGAITGTPNAGTAGVYTYKVVATNDSGTASTSTLTLTVSSGVANTLTFTTQPVGGARSGALLTTQPVLELKDSSGRLIAQPTAVVATVSAGGTLGGTTTVNTASGVVTYTNLTLAGLVNTNYTITFTSGAVTATSNNLQVTPGNVSTIEILTEPVSAAAAGALMTTQPVVRLKDAQGNVVNDRSETVSVSSVLASDTTTSAGAVTGSQAAGLATTTGTVTFTNLAFGGTIGTNYKLKFSNAAGSPAFSANVASTQAGSAAKLLVQTQPTITAAQVVGDAFATQPVIQILDTGDNLTTSTASVTATPSGGTLGGTSSVAAVSGTATFAGLTFAGILVTNYTLTFSSPGLTSVTSSNFQFAAGKVGPVSTVTTSITASPSTLPADATTTATLTVQTKDAGGNNLSTSQGTVLLSATVGTIGVVTDNNNGTYTATYTPPSSRGSGSATISGTLNASSLTETAVITLKTTQTITFAQPANTTLGTLPYSLPATSTSGLTVTFTSSTAAVCSVTTSGVVTIKTIGTCTIAADQAGDSIYWAASQVTRSFSVNATTPTAPFITSVAEGNTTAVVSFVAPGFDGGSAITDYEYSIDGGSTWASGASTTSPFTISGLTNGTSYRVQVRAVNAIGAGLASTSSPSFTPKASGGTTETITTTTPSAPRSAQALQDTATAAIVSWKVPQSDGGSSITGYTVTSSPSATCTASMDATAGTGTCTASSLTPGRTYTFTIRAQNANGLGTATTVSYTVPGGGGGGGGGGNPETDTGGGNSGGSGGGGDDDGGDGEIDVAGGPRKPFPPQIPTPDGPSDEETLEVLKRPSTVSVSKLPNMPIEPDGGPLPDSLIGSKSRQPLYVGGVSVMPSGSAALKSARAAGAKVKMANGVAQVGYLTSRRITIAQRTMLQVVSALEPRNSQIIFRLWLQDRSGTWSKIGRAKTTAGRVIFPVLRFDKPGTYQLLATSINGPRAADAEGNPVFGSTTIRTIVIVTPRNAMGTKMCPNMISFKAQSTKLNKLSKRQVRKFAKCLGAMPAIKVSGLVDRATRSQPTREKADVRARNVRKYLRSLGYDGRVKIRTQSPPQMAMCGRKPKKCAWVRIQLRSKLNTQAANRQGRSVPYESRRGL